MSGVDGFWYQAFEIYLGKAKECEKANENEKARKLYLLASESMLKIARTNEGALRSAQIQRADNLIAHAGTLTTGARASSPAGSKRGAVDAAGGKGALGSVSQSNISFDDVAGLTEVKAFVREKIIEPLRHPEVYSLFKVKSGGGVLMFGLPGTGKTTIARAISSELDAPFFHIKASDIKDKYVGEAEKNVVALFEAAKKEPCAVIFFDEFDALGTSGEDSANTTMSGVVSQLKIEMDGFEKHDGALLLLAATNRPWAIDGAFKRPGRMQMLYIPLPDEEVRRELIAIKFRDVPIEEGLDFSGLVRASAGCSGDDLTRVCDACKIAAARRTAKLGEVSAISQQDIDNARDTVRSSISKVEVERTRAFMVDVGYAVPDTM